MKNWIIIIFVVLSLLAVANCRRQESLRKLDRAAAAETAPQTPAPKPEPDWMHTPTAMSNAMRFVAPPPGYTIVCDADGFYAPKERDRIIYWGGYVRTSKWEAVIGAWRHFEQVQKMEADMVKVIQERTEANARFKDCEAP